MPTEGTKRKLKTPLKSGDYIAYEEEWADMSGDGDFEWCPVWIKTEKSKKTKGTISYKEIVARFYRELTGKGLTVVKNHLPVYHWQFVSKGKKATVIAMSFEEDRIGRRLGEINFYDLIKRLGYNDMDEVMEKAGFKLAQEGNMKYWITNRSFDSSTDGFRNRGYSRQEVGLEDALKKLHPEELRKEEEEARKKEEDYVKAHGKEIVVDYTDYDIVE